MRLLIGTVSLNTKPLTEIWLKTLHESLSESSYGATKGVMPVILDNRSKLVVIDNGSTDGVMDLAKDYPWVKFIRNETNIGVAAAWNQIIKDGFDNDGHALFDYYLPANNDIFFTKEWLNNFTKCLEQDKNKEYGWISSFLNDYKEPDITGVIETAQLEGHYWGGIRPEADEVESVLQMENVIKAAYAPFGGIEQFAKVLKGKYGVSLKTMHPKAPLFALSRECIKKVGLFDEYNSPVGLHEDADYCQRVKMGGFKIGAAFGAYAHHYSMMSRTKSEFKKEWWVEAREKAFQEKWGVSSKEMHLIPDNKSFKLDIGSGYGPRKDDHWYHLDIDTQFPDVEFIHDASKPLPFEEDSLEEIYSSNFLEHCEWKNVMSILFNWYQKLKTGGNIEIRVPNFEFAAQRLLDSSWSISYIDGAENNLSHLIMGGDHPGVPHLHKAIFTPRSLMNLMQDVGFINVRNISNEGSWELRVLASK